MFWSGNICQQTIHSDSVIRSGRNEKWHLSMILEDELELIWVVRTACTESHKYEKVHNVFREMEVVFLSIYLPLGTCQCLLLCESLCVCVHLC